MKHPLNITVLLVLLFAFSQVIGLSLVNMDASVLKSVNEKNQTVFEVVHNDTAIGERPQTEGAGSFALLVAGILIGTLILLAIIKFGRMSLWKLWYFVAVWLAMGIAFGVIMWNSIALILALLLAWWKTYKPNPVIHNLTEIFVYAGIAVLIVPILNLLWAFMLLLAISVYDMYAVWQSRHMVKMAMFQAKSQIFAGLSVPKGRGKIVSRRRSVKAGRKEGVAILGGGDIAFPLIFSGVAMEHLMLGGVPQVTALYYSLIITLGATIAISLLFAFSKKGRFYPAMPFITAGCVLGFFIMSILIFI